MMTIPLREATTPHARYQAAVARLVARRDRLTNQQVARLYALLMDVRRQVVDELTRIADPSVATYRAWERNELLSVIDRAAADLVARYRPLAGGAIEQAWDDGAAFQPSALAAAGIDLDVRAISLVQLNVVQEIAAMEVARVGMLFQDAARRIITFGVLGQQTPHAVMRQIADLLATQPSRNVARLGSITWQAERIQRNEMLRAFAVADEVRMADMAHLVPGLRKVWDTAGDPRVRDSHAAAGRRYSPGGEPGPIPVNRDFVVAGVACSGPHDPRLPASETILCRCIRRVWRAEWFAE